MRAEHRRSATSRKGIALALWVPRLLRLYPRAWRERYRDEVAAVLAEHRITLWTMLDVVLGAFDAHLHGDLLPRRLTSMAHRIRSSEITIFCAFVLFCIAWLPLGLVRDPLPVWQSAVAAHPELLIASTILGLAALVATLAILVGGVPLLVSALAQAVAARRWRLLALFAAPLIAAAALVAVRLGDIQWSSVSQSGVLLMRQPIALQVVLILLPLVAIGGSAAAVAAAIARSELSLDMFRFALLPAGVAATALVLGSLGAVALTALLFTEAPQISVGSPALQAGGLLLMLGAALLAGFALRRGVRAARGGEGAA
ncbi:MAG: hypothetical protein ACHQ4H_01750 [Ktedonobacterales bacterium]